MLLFQIVGAAILLVAFAGLQIGWLKPRSDLYLAGNIVGATLLAGSVWIELQWGFAVLNTVWAVVALRSALKEETV